MPKAAQRLAGCLAGILMIQAGLPCATSLAMEDPASSRAGMGLLEAVRITLQHHPDLSSALSDVEVSQGSLQEAGAAFDPTMINEAKVSRQHNMFQLTSDSPLTEQELDSSLVSAGLAQKFRSGVTVKPKVQSVLNRYAYTGDPQDLALSTAPLATGSVVFEVVVPLLKGRGEASAAAEESSAGKRLEASLLNLRHTTSSKVYETVKAYWNVLAAVRNRDLFAASEERTRKALAETKRQVDLDARPPSATVPLEAALAARILSKERYVERIVEARHSLGLAMGLGAEAIENLPNPRLDFPVLTRKVVEDVPDKDALVKLALADRDDYLAARASLESYQILSEAAHLDLRPRLDLDLQVGYTGADFGQHRDSLATDLTSNMSGANFLFCLTHTWPVGNNAARGILAQRLGAQRKQQIARQDLERKIGSQVSVARNKVAQGQNQVELAGRAVELYDKAVEVERKKAKLGESTVQDVLDMEDKLNNAYLDLISSQQSLATAVAELRYQTGCLVRFRDQKGTVERDFLVGLIFPAAGEER